MLRCFNKVSPTAFGSASKFFAYSYLPVDCILFLSFDFCSPRLLHLFSRRSFFGRLVFQFDIEPNRALPMHLV